MQADAFDGVFRTEDGRLVKRIGGEIRAECGKYGRDTSLARRLGMHKDFDSYPMDMPRNSPCAASSSATPSALDCTQRDRTAASP